MAVAKLEASSIHSSHSAAADGVRATSFHKPDVLYEHLARCSTDEAAEFFGPVAAFLAESENPDELLRFQRSDSGVEVQSIAVGL